MDWPDRDAQWEFPDNTPENRERWQRAIDDALGSGALTLTKGAEPNVLWLGGSCPRCDHGLRQRARGFRRSADCWRDLQLLLR